MRPAAFFLAVYFFIGSLMPASHWDELPRLINLISHFEHHEAESGGTFSFADFIMLHYTDNAHQDQEDHSKLPFHQHVCTGVFVAIIPAFGFTLKTAESPRSPIATLLRMNPRDHISDLLQPPRA